MTPAARTTARIAGPALLALALTEWLNLGAFAAQTAPVVYLNGTLLFIGGVAILQAQGRWRGVWTALVSLLGLAAAALGLWRMAAPQAPQQAPGLAADLTFLALGALGVALTVGGYRRPAG